MRVLPVDKGHTRLEYEIYAKNGIEESKMTEFISFLREVEKEVSHYFKGMKLTVGF
jgi:hypothetical protein